MGAVSMAIKIKMKAAAETAQDAFAEGLMGGNLAGNRGSQRDLADENLRKAIQAEAQSVILARASAEASSRSYAPKETPQGAQSSSNVKERGLKETTSAYAISYFNPELNKAELLETKSEIKVSEYPLQSIEDALGQRSLLPIYQFVGTPLMKSEILPWKLEEILGERDYGTPPKSGPGAGEAPISVSEKHAMESAREIEISKSVADAILRKERVEKELISSIVVIEGVVAAVRKGEAMDKAVQRLPPLSRARYLAALRKKMLDRQSVINLLLRDSAFLKGIRKKLGAFSLDDLVSMVRMLRGMDKK